MALYFEEKGNLKAPSIVFIHGGGVSGWMWEKQVEYFDSYHCIIPDLPEHGKSINEKPLSIPDCANRIVKLIISKANGKKAHVIGHSLGAKVLVELLSIKPEVVDRAVVASALFRPIPLIKVTHKPFIYKFTTWLIKSRSLLKYTVKQFKFPNNYYVQNCINDFEQLTSENLYRIYDQLYLHLKLPKGLAKVNVPTLIIAGENEPKAMRQSVIDIANALPNAKGVLIKKGIHTYPWAMYESFNKIIWAWFNNEQIPNEFVEVL
ncbi:MAG: alpha/beta hydrolase [Desulfotomaculaceae bacterium]